MSRDPIREAAAEDLKSRPREELKNMQAQDLTGLVAKELQRRDDSGERG